MMKEFMSFLKAKVIKQELFPQKKDVGVPSGMGFMGHSLNEFVCAFFFFFQGLHD